MKIVRPQPSIKQRTWILIVAALVVLVLGVWAFQIITMLNAAKNESSVQVSTILDEENRAFLEEFQTAIGGESASVGELFGELKGQIESAILRAQIEKDVAETVRERLESNETEENVIE